jgi:murein DD-endopeptidase MepM/ murein hydrolase activator NlpD
MHLGKKLLFTIITLLLVSFSLITALDFPSRNTTPKSFAPERPQEPWLEATIPNGGSIFAVMEQLKIPAGEIASFSYNIGEYIDVTTIQPGDTLRVLMSPDMTKITKAMYVQEPTIRHHFVVKNDSLVYTMESLPVTTQVRIIDGELNKTLDASLLAYGFDAWEKQQINTALEGDINFQRDARNGDKFRILVEERIFEGKKLPRGKILYTIYSGERTGQHELFRYVEGDDKSVMNGLYNKEGKSNSTSGVGFPLSNIHVVSAFGNRIHPIFRRWMFHQGVDYRGRNGTPVYAVANGTVMEARYNGGWGNNVRIKHPSGMITLSAHLASMSVRSGQTVKKGQVIGRVGSTGQSTGAHLHFGLMQGKSWINPSRLKMVGAERLNDKQMVDFRLQQSSIRALIQTTESSANKLLVRR